MIENIEDLLNEIRNGNSQEHKHENIELKESWHQKYGKDLSALGNKLHNPCCWLVVGVKDDGSLAGKSEAKAVETERIISQQINEYLDPIQACKQIICREVSGSWIVVVCIKNPGDVVYWGNDVYSASGTTSHLLSPDEILGLRIQLPGLTDYSSQLAQGEYDENLVHCFMQEVKKSGHFLEIAEDPLESLQRLSICDKQVSRILFGNCGFRLIKFDKFGDPIANIKYLGLYRVLTDKFQDEIQKWTAEQLNINISPYPEKALREALANAVAHAAYFEQDGDLILELYPDHLSISNLCLRESVYFANRWFSRSHKTINSLLMETLRIAHQVDELGRGKNLIFSHSIREGKHPPEVIIEKAGKYERWKLLLYGGTTDKLLLRLLERIKEVYKDDQKSLIAFSLVLWRDKKVQEIKKYVDGDFSRQFADVLSGLKGPIFYYEQEDQIFLVRWARVLLGDGKDSKSLSHTEEKRLKEFTYNVCTEFYDHEITPSILRSTAQMGNTGSEKSLLSTILIRWEREGLIRKISRGKYRWIKRPEDPNANTRLQNLRKLFETEETKES